MMKLLVNQITRRFPPCKALLPALLLTTCLIYSCLDENRLSVTYDSGCLLADEADMYMSINVPRTYAGSGVANKENAVETLDVLVFAKGVAEPDKYFVHAACKGTLANKDDNKFQVVMPVGKNFIVHVFANCHEAMVAKGFYNSRGKEMNAMLALLNDGMNVNARAVDALPMHGYITDVSIDKSKVNSRLDVPVLRSVAAVQVMTKATVKDGILTPENVTDDSGKKNFELRELYIYFYPDSGRVAAAPDAYMANSSSKDQTRDVEKVSLPKNHRVSDTRWKDDTDPERPKPYSIISATSVDYLGCLYLYENKPYSDTGFDQPDNTNPAATSRLVVGGVYNNEKQADGTTPKVTYYRVDFADSDNHLSEILRNHKYTFSIEKVSGSGYETPDDAATGVPINIYIEVINWTNDIEHVDFDRRNFFYSQTKSIELARNANSSRSIIVDSDVPVDEWKLNFKTETNGTANTTVENTISNNRYMIEKASDGKSLTFTVLKAYKDLLAGESRDEILVLKARELEITYQIVQVDKSPDDWGNGGDKDVEVAPKTNDTEVNDVHTTDWENDDTKIETGGELN